jgi:glutamate N-acetyltransferase/amino-acid N-acetyltransferase
MAVGLVAPTSLLPIAGCRLAAVEAGIRYKNRKDLVVVAFDEGTETAAVFTQNAFCAAPVVVAKQHLSKNAPRALLVNSGNANCGTGQRGMDDATASCAALADALGCDSSEVLPFSTGVIGEYLPIDKFPNAVKQAAGQLASTHWLEAAHAIMTTDTVAKGLSKQVETPDGVVTITGIAKGSGMIRPDMATMLSYIATDAAVRQSDLQALLSSATEISFNAVTVDGDTSTNDACTLSATGASRINLGPSLPYWAAFSEAVTEICLFLAQALIRDGEGASKFVTVNVVNARSTAQAKSIAYTVAHSPLVKTALFASDPNWGRLLAAIGRAPVEAALDVSKIDICLDDVKIVSSGERDSSYLESAGQAVMDQDEISINISIGMGAVKTTVWTSDLSHDYVTINADYRS